MQKYAIVFLLIFISSCQFLQEIWEPKDLVYVVRAQKDYLEPSITILSPTNGQNVSLTYQIYGNVIDIGVKNDVTGVDKVFIRIDRQPFIPLIPNAGVWSYVFSSTEGIHTNEVYAVDKRGNVSKTNMLIVQIQGAIPSIIVSNPPNCALTNQSYIMLEGSSAIGSPNFVTKVFVKTSADTTGTAAFYNPIDKIWKYFLTLKDGTNLLFISAVASSGFTNTVEWKLILDKTPPLITVTSPPNMIEVGAVYTFSGNIGDNLSGLKTVEYRLDSGIWKTLAVSNGMFSTNIAIPNTAYGMHINAIRAMDVAGNTTNIERNVIRAAIPIVKCTLSNVYYTNISTIDLKGLVLIDSPYSIYNVMAKLRGGSSILADISGSNWIISNLTLSKVTNILTINATTYNSNTFSEFKAASITNLTIFFDNQNPTVGIMVPFSDCLTNQRYILIYGDHSDLQSGVSRIEVRVSNAFTNFITNALLVTDFFPITWYIELYSNFIIDGTNRFEVIAKDFANNSSSMLNRIIVCDSVAPTIVMNTPSATTTTIESNNYRISGSASDAIGGLYEVSVSVDTGYPQHIKTASMTSWSTNLTGLADGSYTIRAQAIDKAGNITSIPPRTLIVDRAGPVCSIAALLTYTHHNAFTVSGTASDLSGVKEIWVSFSKSGDHYVKLPGAASWSTNVASLTPGTYTAKVYAVDMNNKTGATNLTTVEVRTPYYSETKIWQTFNTYEGLINGMDVNSSGDIVFAGAFANTLKLNPSDSGSGKTAVGNQDALIIKMNSAGGYLWGKTFGGTRYDKCFAVCFDPSGNIYAVGTFESNADFDPGAGTDMRSSAGEEDIFITKYTSDGSLLWTKTIGSTGFDFAFSVCSDPSGNVLVAGMFQGTVNFNPGGSASNVTASGTAGIYTLKLDSSGSFVWVRTLPGVPSGNNYSLKTDSSGNVYLLSSFINTVDFNPGASIDNFTSVGVDCFLSKYTGAGLYDWTKVIGGSDDQRGKSLAIDSADQIIITGTFEGTGIDFNPNAGTDNKNSLGGTDFFITKLLNDGVYINTVTVGGSGSEEVTGVDTDISNNIYLTGTYMNTVDFNPTGAVENWTFTGGNKDAFITKYDAGLNYQWTVTVRSSANDSISGIAVNLSGNSFYASGTFNTNTDFDPSLGDQNVANKVAQKIYLSIYGQ